VAGPITRQIVLEFDIEQPMHALDAPMPARTPGDAFDVERRGRDMVVRFEAAAIGIFGTCVDLEDSLDVLEARLARIASLGCYPVDLAGGGVGARLDPAMSLLDGGFADEFIGGRGAEIVLDIGFERGLVALEGKQVIGLVSNDLVGNLDLAAHGVDGDERTLKLFGLGELIEKIGDGGDLVGLLCAKVSLAWVA
jgi:hypothetical protein